MKFTKSGKILLIATVAALLGIGTYAFAGWGMGWGHHRGAGMHRGWSGSAGYQANLSAADLNRINQQRQAFFEQTRSLRENLFQKQLELRSELAKQNPDSARAATLQKDISDLRGRLDQKRVEHRIRMQKENPGFFAGRGNGRGGNRQMGPGMGRGFGDRGYGMNGGAMGRGFQGNCRY